ncbi:hypothetical protein LA303_01695 [Candidatus Sulfidibacterium hydrothermale]|uniref:hypothetical protein n=1 Tax=Candidatus Sulfidibacterium hydrothermale TaxID=2875962 RepID=UPI001F0B40D1|nr:hypothetical protein [Candidatus Sulfidibacterium hydrothermale]UBM62705.1 hypothetical protein LA303_01695 [Candidatus Sulfidibacterium hydrothermale]
MKEAVKRDASRCSAGHTGWFWGFEIFCHLLFCFLGFPTLPFQTLVIENDEPKRAGFSVTILTLITQFGIKKSGAKSI